MIEYFRLRNKHRAKLINFWKILKQNFFFKWPQCLDWCMVISGAESRVESFLTKYFLKTFLVELVLSVNCSVRTAVTAWEQSSFSKIPREISNIIKLLTIMYEHWKLKKVTGNKILFPVILEWCGWRVFGQNTFWRFLVELVLSVNCSVRTAVTAWEQSSFPSSAQSHSLSLLCFLLFTMDCFAKKYPEILMTFFSLSMQSDLVTVELKVS